jgi:hypothetical protein
MAPALARGVTQAQLCEALLRLAEGQLGEVLGSLVWRAGPRSWEVAGGPGLSLLAAADRVVRLAGLTWNSARRSGCMDSSATREWV